MTHSKNSSSSILLYVTLNILSMLAFSLSAQLPPTAQPGEKSLLKEPSIRIQCLSGTMLITIKDAPASNGNGLFNGMIYPKGLSKNSSCLSEYRNNNGLLKYKLPLRSCNTMPQEANDGSVEFFNTIVLQPHLKLVTDLGRGYHVRCRYKSQEAATPSMLKKRQGKTEALIGGDNIVDADRRSYGRSMSAIINTVDNQHSMPGCHMKIMTGEKVAENVKIGDPLTLNILMDKQNVYGLHVTDCMVRDGLGWGEQRLVNDFGCPVDGEIMGVFDYSDDRTTASVSFPAHKFPYTASVYYECKVRVCELKDETCHKAPNCFSKRPKRDAYPLNHTGDDDGEQATIKVYSGLYVNENAEILDNDTDTVFAEKTPDDALCVSQRTFAISIAIAGLVLMLLVVMAVLCIMAKRRHKTVSQSGSSIYSGPYTNTAMSHSS